MGSYDVLVCKRSGQLMMIELKLKSKAGETIAHLYRPGLDGRPTYAHGEENPLEVLNLEVKYSLIIIQKPSSERGKRWHRRVHQHPQW